MRERITNVIVIILFLLGLSLLLYPSISNYWNNLHQTKVIDYYVEDIKGLDKEIYKMFLKNVRDYNRTLIGNSIAKTPNEKEYNNILNINGGQIGYIRIPEIDILLPIYHGTSEEVLQVAIGHVASSSFPIGDEGTHTILLGHRGLPSAKLFTDLPQLKKGDFFYITILDKETTFEIDEIKVVEPNDLKNIIVEKDKTYATLVTCTPYAINSHRLLVRGHKIELNEKEEKNISNDEIDYSSESMNEILVIYFIIYFTVLSIILLLMISLKNREKKYINIEII